MVVRGSAVDGTRGGQERKEWGRIYSGILFLWRLVWNVPHWDWHLNLVQYDRGERGDLASGKGL